jgi:hypothetical protein
LNCANGKPEENIYENDPQYCEWSALAVDAQRGRSLQYGANGGALGTFERRFGGSDSEKMKQAPPFAELISIVAGLNGTPFSTPPRCEKKQEKEFSEIMKDRKKGRDARRKIGRVGPKAGKTALQYFALANPSKCTSSAAAATAYKDLPKAEKSQYSALAAKDTYRRVLASIEDAQLDEQLDDDDDNDDMP